MSLGIMLLIFGLMALTLIAVLARIAFELARSSTRERISEAGADFSRRIRGFRRRNPDVSPVSANASAGDQSQSIEQAYKERLARFKTIEGRGDRSIPDPHFRSVVENFSAESIVDKLDRAFVRLEQGRMSLGSFASLIENELEFAKQRHLYLTTIYDPMPDDGDSPDPVAEVEDIIIKLNWCRDWVDEYTLQKVAS